MGSVDGKIAPIKHMDWDDNSLVSRVELREQGKGRYVAYVHANEKLHGDYDTLIQMR